MSVLRLQSLMALAVAGVAAWSAQAWNGNVLLNQYAVKNGNGAIQVLGTEGSWSNRGNTKEKVFDGDASTFFDPPDSAASTGGAWAGIQLTSPVMVTRVRYAGRSGFGSRMEGCVYQGANSPDFSDAETFMVAMPPSGWNGEWAEVVLDNVYGPYTYLRVKGSDYCGNAAEVEFYGLAESGAEIPAEPVIDFAWLLNRHAGFRLTSDATVPQVYRVQRREDDGEDFATFSVATVDSGGDTVTWIDPEVSKGGEYRVRGVNANGKGPWAYFTITNRNEAAGTWIGTEGSWNNYGDVGSNAFDSNPWTVVDAESSGSPWTGLDLGTPQYIAGVRFMSRPSNSSRMVGGTFEGANTANFSDAVLLHTIVDRPSSGIIHEVSFGDAGGYYRYVRYVSPSGGHCNVAEIAFLLPEGSIDGPASPVASTPPGFSAASVSVALDYAVDGAEIFYTLDGSTPVGVETENCFRYRAPITFGDVCSKTNRLALIPTNPPEMWNHAQYGWKAPSVDQPNVNVLRARAFKNGLMSTNEFAGTWLVGTVPNQHTLRVVSLQTDEANFFSDPTGLMVPGDVYNRLGWNGHSVGLPNANYFQHGSDWERPVVFELFETNREEVASQLLGVRMHGAWSRSCAQKTMGLYTRKEYGKKKLKYQLFRDDPETDFKRFLLRNSGNDWYKSGLRDAFGQSLFRGWVKTGTQGYEPTVVYINGEYWGIMNFRSHYSKHYFESKYGADPDNIDFLKLQRNNSDPYEVQEGDAKAYGELLDYLSAHNLGTDQAAYEYVCMRIDVDDLIEHNLIHMFLGNTDWPDNNQGFWRERVEYSPTAPAPHDGRWRFCAYDTDHGLGLGSNAGTDMIGYANGHYFFKSLSANRDFINRLASRTADLLNSALAPERTTAILDAAAARVRGEIPRHIARWSRQGSLSSWESELNNIRSYLNQRGEYMRTHLNNYFGVGSSYPLTVAVQGDGRVKVNSLSSGGGEGRIALPFTGRYFANVPVKLTATPEPGRRFVAWIVDDDVRTEASIELSVTQATTATAYFRQSEPPNLVVNEVMSDADTPDWFELHNAGTEDFDLGGCWLTDDSDKHLTEIPVGVVVPAGGFLLVRADDSFLVGVDADGVLNMPFGLGKKGDEVNLWSADRTRRLAHVAFGAATHNVSVGCWPNGSTNEGHWVAMTVPTPGAPNRSPLATGAWLPDGVSTQVVAGAQVALDCAVTNTTLTGGYAFVDGPALGAGISNAGLFTWNVPSRSTPGAYEFRISWTSADGTAADETTVLVQVVKPAEDVDIPMPPPRPRMGATRNSKTPLIYWTQSAKAVAYDVERATTCNGPYSKVATLGRSASIWLDESATTTTNWYRIVARSKDEMESVSDSCQAWSSGIVHKLEGLVVGTSGSWSNVGNVKEKAFDGDTSTFFDSPESTSWMGLDLGSVKWRVVKQFRYWPRNDWSKRMTNNQVQVGKTSDGEISFDDPLTIYTISSQPAERQWNTATLSNTNEWRYIRYNDISGGHGNASELEFLGFDEVPAVPGDFTVATNVPMMATLTWPAVPHAEGYLLWTNSVVCGYVSTNAATFARSTKRISRLGVSAVNGSGQSSRRQIMLPKAPPPPSVLFFR